MTDRGTPALAALRRAGVDHTVRPYEAPERYGRDRAERPDYGAEAAAALGVEPGRVLKTLVVAIDGGALVVAVLPVDRELDLKAIAAAVGGRRAELADARAAERATGSVVGGISPIGQRRRLRTVVDAAAVDQDTVLVSGGRRGLQVELRPRDLVTLVGASVQEIARPVR